jgi:hypothetical protein
VSRVTRVTEASCGTRASAILLDQNNKIENINTQPFKTKKSKPVSL